jgi:RND family efflux transporter MFP subunit
VHNYKRWPPTILLLVGTLAGLAGGCSGSGEASGASAGAGDSTAGAARTGSSIVLSERDVHTVVRDTIESAVAVSGDLKPIEDIVVRARIEGDLVEVPVREGDRVREGQLLARFEDSEQLSERASASADSAAAAGELATATWNAEQADELFRAGAIPERDARAARQAVEAARARLAAALARVRATSSLTRDTRIVAPTTGTIERRLIENGEHVARGAELFTLVRSDVLELAAAVPARQAGDIRPQQVVRFSAAGRSFEGRVARVSPTINTANRSLTVYVRVPNADGAVRGNTLATGRIVGRSIPDALVVPVAALRQTSGDGATFVYRLVDDVLEHADVQLGIVDDVTGIAEVTSGLAEGDRIVVGNVGVLGRGMKVRIVTGESPAPLQD